MREAASEQDLEEWVRSGEERDILILSTKNTQHKEHPAQRPHGKHSGKAKGCMAGRQGPGGKGWRKQEEKNKQENWRGGSGAAYG